MSAPGPESIPTSADPRSHRPTKKRALTPNSAQAASVDALFARPDQDIRIPAADDAARASGRPPPPEIVTNVQGSSAGAGSGEFHVYKASRRREYERLRDMDEEVKKGKDQAEFEKEKAERDRKDEERTRKNREKREKLKARKSKKAKGGDAPGEKSRRSPETTKKPLPTNGTHETDEDGATKVAEDGKKASAEPVGIVIHDDD